MSIENAVLAEINKLLGSNLQETKLNYDITPDVELWKILNIIPYSAYDKPPQRANIGLPVRGQEIFHQNFLQKMQKQLIQQRFEKDPSTIRRVDVLNFAPRKMINKWAVDRTLKLSEIVENLTISYDDNDGIIPTVKEFIDEHNQKCEDKLPPVLQSTEVKLPVISNIDTIRKIVGWKKSKQECYNTMGLDYLLKLLHEYQNLIETYQFWYHQRDLTLPLTDEEFEQIDLDKMVDNFKSNIDLVKESPSVDELASRYLLHFVWKSKINISDTKRINQLFKNVLTVDEEKYNQLMDDYFSLLDDYHLTYTVEEAETTLISKIESLMDGGFNDEHIKKCQECDGDGKIGDDDDESQKVCKNCNGRGYFATAGASNIDQLGINSIISLDLTTKEEEDAKKANKYIVTDLPGEQPEMTMIDH